MRDVSSSYFSGFSLNAVDAKGRVSVPASFREVIERRSGERRVIVAPHADEEDCLIGYDIGHFDEVQAALDARYPVEAGAPARTSRARRAFGLAANLPYEENGRMLLTDLLRDYAELRDQALFLGAGAYFEIWKPELLIERTDDKIVARFVRRQLDAKGRGI